MNYLYIEDLYIIDINKKYYLLDTACPISYFADGFLLLNEIKYESQKPIVLIDRLEKLSKIINLNLSGIFGFDIIKNTGLYINKELKEISFEIRKIEGRTFNFEIAKYHQYEFIELTFDTYGLSRYGVYTYILDSGISKTLLAQSICSHSQYAYRKDIYYLALELNTPVDFVFETFKQADNEIHVETGMSEDYEFLSQLEDVKAMGLIALNDVFEREIVIDTRNNQIIQK